MGVLSAEAWADELEKVATAWKERLVRGQIASEEKQRLLQEGVLSFGKELVGLRKGTDQLISRLGYKEVPSVREAIKDFTEGLSAAGATREQRRAYIQHTQNALATSLTLRGVNVDPVRRRLYTYGLGLLTRKAAPADAEYLRELLRRHEADELLALRRPRSFQSYEAAPSWEKALYRLPKLRDVPLFYAQAVRQGRRPVASHGGPEVIGKEIGHLQVAPQSVADAFIDGLRAKEYPMYTQSFPDIPLDSWGGKEVQREINRRLYGSARHRRAKAAK